jgi:hypothetical protein
MEYFKKCNKCEIEKTSEYFMKMKRSKDGLDSYCKKCKSELMSKYKEYYKNYYIENTETIKQRSKEYNQNNKERVNNYKQKYYLENKDSINEYKNNYIKNRKSKDSLFKLKCNVRTLILNSINRNGFKKNSQTSNIIECSFEELKLYLEKKFESWMTWDNYGKYNGELNYGWDIDHIIPISSSETKEDVFKLNSYKNLQPLCSKVNRDIKRDKK